MKNIPVSNTSRDIENKQTFEEMKVIYTTIETSIRGGDFREDGGQQKVFADKDKFLNNLRKLLSDRTIKKLFVGDYDLSEFTSGQHMAFGNISAIYTLLCKYFEDLEKSKNIVADTKKNAAETLQKGKGGVFIVSEMETDTENVWYVEGELYPVAKTPYGNDKIPLKKEKDVFGRGWDKISAIFEVDDISSDNCYAVSENFNRLQYSDKQLQKILKDLHRLQQNKTIQGSELLTFVEFLIAETNHYLEEIDDKDDLPSELQVKENEKAIASKIDTIFNNTISCFNYFVAWVIEQTKAIGDLHSYQTFNDLQSDPERYPIFSNFAENFPQQLQSMIIGKYKIAFEAEKSISRHDYALLFSELTALGSLYTDMNQDRFFFALKRGFLLGDIYDFLNQHIKKNPALHDKLQDFLKARLSEYLS